VTGLGIGSLSMVVPLYNAELVWKPYSHISLLGKMSFNLV
jgi:hypothetical protein